jgi:hypothetical protein
VKTIPNAATTLAFSPQGKLLASGHDSHVRLWSTESWEEVRSLPDARYPAVFSPDGQWLVTGAVGGYRVWSTETWEPAGYCAGEPTFVWQSRVAFSLDGKLLVTAGHKGGREVGQFQVWDFPSLTVRAGGYTVVGTNVAGSVTSQVATLTVDTTFTKITSGLIVTRAGSGRGCAWGDYNNDGFIDLYVANSAADGRGTTGGTDFLFQNNRDGTFTEARATARITDPVDSQACVWADYDNDGHVDLFVSAYFGGNNKNTLYRNQGDGTFTKVGNDKLVSEGGNSTAAAWGDFNNDGFVDLVVANSLFSGSPSLDLFYQNLGEAGFLKLTNNIVSEPRYGRGVSWADYDNDGRLDLFVANAALSGAQQLNRLYRNLGGGIFQPIAGSGPGGEGAVSFSGSWADCDNDGDLDLFVANGGWEQVRANFLYRNNGNGTFTKITDGDIVADRFGSVYGTWGDYDNDGFLDLFVSHSSPANTSPSYQPTAKNSLYHNNGDGTFRKVTSGSLVNDLGCSLGSAWGDYDNDGFLDLYVTNFGSRVNDLFHNNGNTNSWIIIKCIGTVANRSAIGAKVRVKATIRGQTTWQMRENSGGGGYTSQNDVRAHFGLGDATMIDTLRIEWPSGIVQELHDVAAKQFLMVAEPARLQALGAGALRIQSWKGMRFDVQASTDLSQWSPLTTVTNLTGTLEFTDPNVANDFRRFYRTLLR